MADGTRTHDNGNHNPGLYQLSYSHRESQRLYERAAHALPSAPVREPYQRGSLADASCASADSLTVTLKRDFSAA